MTWEKVKLGDYCESIADGDHQAPPKAEYGIPFITISNFTPYNDIDFSNTLFVPEDYYNAIKPQRKAQAGDILYSVVGSFGIPIYLKSNKKFAFQRHVAILRPSDKINGQFLYYAMCDRSFYSQADAVAVGAAQRTVSLSALRNMTIELPPRDVQDTIAGILTKYDELIENSRKQIALLEEAAQRLYREWFVDFRFPGSTSHNSLPQDWQEKTLGDTTSKFATGLNPRKNFKLGHGNNYYITIKNMGDNTIYLDDKCDKVDDEALAKINRRSDLQKGDLLFSGIGTIGRVHLIDEPPTNWNISESVFTIRPKDNIPSEFMYLLLLDDAIQGYAESNAHGCAQKGIRMADLKAFKYVLPSADIMDAFISLVGPMIKNVQNLRRLVAELVSARDTLLPKLMSGELKV